MNYDAIENPFIFGKLPSGRTVVIRLVQFPGNVEIVLDTLNLKQVCPETAVPGYYVWDFRNLDRSQFPPLSPNHSVTFLYVMSDGTGYEFSGKVILGHYPEMVRRTYSLVQVPL